MNCRKCGTEIADKALICYRCGAPVTEAVHKPAPLKSARRPLGVYIVFALLVVAAIFVLWIRSH
ncbi:MAG TPA: zinc-ribbon domain-containing protein [Vicinamibacterales bacterium]|jgi:predicted amidophosphoribosyltransferase|nr:zinc-ribbon domain-containing protein [Vicinamibacterales bacterium]